MSKVNKMSDAAYETKETLVSAEIPEEINLSDKIFLITRHYDYEGFTILGIYEDINKAIDEYYRIADSKEEYRLADEINLDYYTKNKNLDDEESVNILYTRYGQGGRIQERTTNIPRIKGISPYMICSATVAPFK